MVSVLSCSNSCRHKRRFGFFRRLFFWSTAILLFGRCPNLTVALCVQCNRQKMEAVRQVAMNIQHSTLSQVFWPVSGGDLLGRQSRRTTKNEFPSTKVSMFSLFVPYFVQSLVRLGLTGFRARGSIRSPHVVLHVSNVVFAFFFFRWIFCFYHAMARCEFYFSENGS